jgi:23S rRNA (adenine2503-C2)-methyltransferase
MREYLTTKKDTHTKHSRKTLRMLHVYKREDRYFSKYYDQQVAYKYLFALHEEHSIESAAYQHFRGVDRMPQDLSIDISSMIGCPMGCTFCESSLIPYKRCLTVDEMVAQVASLVEKHDRPRFPQIMCSFQGIGEPSLVAEEVIEASERLLMLDDRFDISIATIGANLKAFRAWRESNVPIHNLQISSSGITDEQLKRIIPNSPGVVKLVDEAQKCFGSSNFHKVKFNYILLDRFNDSERDVEQIISFFRDTGIIVKISALNPTAASQRAGLCPGSLERAVEMCKELLDNNVDSFVYGSFNDTNVSCGQLKFYEG